MSRRPVPMALRSELEMPLGPLGNFPLRTIVLVALAGFPALMAIFIPVLPLEGRFVIAIMILGIAFGVSLPKLDGIWIVTYLIYKRLPLPNATTGARRVSLRTNAVWHGDAMSKDGGRPAPTKVPVWRGGISIPRLATIKDQDCDELNVGGLMRLLPGGWRGVLTIEGPTTAVFSEAYEKWNAAFMDWLSSLDCPAQIVTVVDHYSPSTAQAAFDARLRANLLGGSELVKQERDLAGMLAANSFGLKSYLILDPAAAHQSGIPRGLELADLGRGIDTRFVVVDEIVNQALRTAETFGIKAYRTPLADINKVAALTPLAAKDSLATDRAVKVDNNLHTPFVITGLPKTIAGGDIIDAVVQARSQAIISVHLYPVHPTEAKKKVTRLVRMHYSAAKSKGGGVGQVEDPIAIAEGEQMLASFAQGERAFVTSTTVDLFAPNIHEVEDAGARFCAYADAKGFVVVRPRQPGLLPALAAAPGCAPLKRSCLMTTKTVAECLVPVLGTAFNDMKQALIGVNEFTGAPAYWDCWHSNTNHNLLMLGTSGGGKSVALKTMLYRHYLAGTNFVVIDPEGEYENLIAACDGEYYSLGEHSLNPFTLALSATPEEASASISPLLSILAGDQMRDEQGRPIRYLDPADSSWLQTQLVDFLRQVAYSTGTVQAEPVLSNFVDYLDKYAAHRAVSDNDAERARKMRDRLTFYTQGSNGAIFNRRSTFAIGTRPVGIGLKAISNQFQVDLTPAMALVLTALLKTMAEAKQRLLLVIDEASALTANPDAGAVVQQIIRRGRKRATGIWMASQNLDDFVGTTLGDTMASSSAAKWILGVQESQLEAVVEAFKLSPAEARVISPARKGAGLLLTDGGVRSAVVVLVSNCLLSQVGTTPDVVDDDYHEGLEGAA